VQKIVDYKFHEAVSHGKSLFLIFKNGKKYAIIHSKFGLHGDWAISSDEVSYTKAVRIVIEMSNGLNCVFTDPTNFGNTYLINYNDMLQIIVETFDPLKEDITMATLQLHLSHGRIKTKNVSVSLLEQEPISGIGNYLRSEILYAAKIHPLTTCEEILRNGALQRALLKAINQIPVKIYTAMKANKRDYFKVYSRDRTPKGEPVETISINKRTVYFVGDLRSPTLP
jgi:formamidopyrimidine-DNA glycosylase